MKSHTGFKQESMGSEIIRTEGLSKYYGDGEALVKSVDQVNLSIWKGEITAIVGKSGSGKTTLLHMMGGLEPPTKGRVLLDGSPLYEMNDSRRTKFRRERIGFIFQKFQLIPDMTIRQNLQFPLDVAGKKKDKAFEEELISMLDLEDRLGFYPHQLSGGGQQRAAIARALLLKPDLILADEPTGNIDEAAGQELLKFILRSNEKYGQTFVIVTHDMAAAGMAHRIVRLKDGMVQPDSGEENRRGHV
ncbi:ABC transporter ATP-binding protein [Qiania dongpingensis]|nr:ABC transporter ATP-binding protein [Qiania dongpingensis]